MSIYYIKNYYLFNLWADIKHTWNILKKKWLKLKQYYYRRTRKEEIETLRFVLTDTEIGTLDTTPIPIADLPILQGGEISV